MVMQDGKLITVEERKYVRVPALARVGEVILINERGYYQIDLFCREGEDRYVPIYASHEVDEITEMEFLAEVSR